MSQTVVFLAINPMEASNYPRGNLLSSSSSIPTVTSNPFPSHSHTRNPSFPRSATMSPGKNQHSANYLRKKRHIAVPPDKLQETREFLSGLSQMRPFPPDTQISKQLRTLAGAGHYIEALSYFVELQLLGGPVSLYTLKVAINCYCNVNQVGFAFSLLGRMFKRGYRPNILTFNTLLKMLVLGGKKTEALELYGKLRRNGEIQPNEVTYRTIIQVICKKANKETATSTVDYIVNILYEMEEKRVHPDVIVYNTLIRWLCNLSIWKEAAELLIQMSKRGIKLNVVLYGKVVNGLCKTGNTSMAVGLLRILEAGGFKSNTKVYSMIIDSLCKDGMVDDAMNFLLEMNGKGICPNVVTYTSLIHGLYNCGKWKEARAMVGEMFDSGVSPDLHTFTMFINALTKQGMAREAEEVLETMVERGEDPNVVTYSTLMNGYCVQGRMDEAKRVFDSMVDRGLQPNIISYHILITGYCKNMKLDEAVKLFREIPRAMVREVVHSGVSPDVHTFTMLMDALTKQGMAREAEDVLEIMMEGGYDPDVVTY